MFFDIVPTIYTQIQFKKAFFRTNITLNSSYEINNNHIDKIVVSILTHLDERK